MKKLLLTLAVASVALTSSAATRILYEQNFETVSTPEEAGWSIAGGTMSIASDQYGKFLELQLGQNNGRSGQVTWGQNIFLDGDGNSVLEDGTYNLEFSFSIKQGSNNQWNSCITIFTNRAPLASQPYRNPWNPVGYWENYLFDMSQVANEATQYAVYGKRTETTGDDGTVTYGIDYSTPNTFATGTWYKVSLNVDTESRNVEYSVESLDGTIVTSGDYSVPAENVDGSSISMFAEGLFLMMARYQTIFQVDDIKISYESSSDVANTPVVSLTSLGKKYEREEDGTIKTDDDGNELVSLDLNMRTYTVTFLEGETLHVVGTDGVETPVDWYDVNGKYIYETTKSGTLKVWTTSGEAKSDVVEVDVDCNPCVLPQAVATISSVTEGFGKTYTLTVDNSDVPLRPTVFINYVFTGKSGKTVEAKNQASGCQVVVEEEGTLKVTTTAFGYQENPVTVENNLQFEVKKMYDFARMNDDEIKAAGFPDWTVLNTDHMGGFDNWSARKYLWYEVEGSEHDNGEGTMVRDKAYPFGFVAADNTTNVINYALVAHADETDNSAHKSYFDGLTIFDANQNVGFIKHIGIYNDQTNKPDSKPLYINNLDQSDFVVVNYINGYGSNSNHPVVANDEEYFKVLAGTDVVYSVAASGVLDEATQTYSITHGLYRVDTACTKITVFKQAGAQSGLENVVVAEEENTDEGWYTITGLRLEKPTAPGLYIHKGKKVIVK